MTFPPESLQVTDIDLLYIPKVMSSNLNYFMYGSLFSSPNLVVLSDLGCQAERSRRKEMSHETWILHEYTFLSLPKSIHEVD